MDLRKGRLASGGVEQPLKDRPWEGLGPNQRDQRNRRKWSMADRFLVSTVVWGW